MIRMKPVLMVIILTCVCACSSQEPPPPMPSQVIESSARFGVESIDPLTGDVSLQYYLVLENISEEPLEKIVLKDFQCPEDLFMEYTYFEIFVLHPGEKKALQFPVVIKGWGRAPQEKTWIVNYTIRLEKGNTHSEEGGFSYRIQMAP